MSLKRSLENIRLQTIENITENARSSFEDIIRLELTSAAENGIRYGKIKVFKHLPSYDISSGFPLNKPWFVELKKILKLEVREVFEWLFDYINSKVVFDGVKLYFNEAAMEIHFCWTLGDKDSNNSITIDLENIIQKFIPLIEQEAKTFFNCMLRNAMKCIAQNGLRQGSIEFIELSPYPYTRLKNILPVEVDIHRWLIKSLDIKEFEGISVDIREIDDGEYVIDFSW
jgi:hypothetical protein